MHLYTTATEITPADVIFYLKNLQIDPSSFALNSLLICVWSKYGQIVKKKG